MANVWSGVTIDCLGPERVARFWGVLLGREPGPSQDGWVYLGQPGETLPRASSSNRCRSRRTARSASTST